MQMSSDVFAPITNRSENTGGYFFTVNDFAVLYDLYLPI